MKKIRENETEDAAPSKLNSTLTEGGDDDDDEDNLPATVHGTVHGFMQGSACSARAEGQFSCTPVHTFRSCAQPLSSCGV